MPVSSNFCSDKCCHRFMAEFLRTVGKLLLRSFRKKAMCAAG
jgi:hypothetical protein